MRVKQEEIEVARDAWQEDEGVGERWRDLLKDHPTAIVNYIGKRFAREREHLEQGKQSSFRITSLTYERGDLGWDVTDNTPGWD